MLNYLLFLESELFSLYVEVTPQIQAVLCNKDKNQPMQSLMQVNLHWSDSLSIAISQLSSSFLFLSMLPQYTSNQSEFESLLQHQTLVYAEIQPVS